MKKLLLALLACTLTVASRAQDVAATIRLEAEKCAKALVTGDYAQAAAYTHPRIVAAMGGKDVLIAQISNGRKQVQAEGLDLIEAKIGTPTSPKKIGGWLTSFVPQEVVIKAPDGRVVQESILLAVSEDEGKTWSFIDLSGMTPQLLAKHFPEIAAQITLPQKKKPVFQKDGKR